MQGLDFVAYAKDAVTWFHFTKTTANTPSSKISTLSPPQLAQIWQGSVYDWGQLGATKTAPIVVFSAQEGSGTQSTWQTFLDNTIGGGSSFDPTAASNPVNCVDPIAAGSTTSKVTFPASTTLAGCVGPIGSFENIATTMLSTQASQVPSNLGGNTPAANGIFFYSFGKYSAQCAGVKSKTTYFDKSAGPVTSLKANADCGGTTLPTGYKTALGEIGGVAANPQTILATSGTVFPDDRFVFNVYSNGSDTTHPSQTATPATLNYMSEVGFLCKPQTVNGAAETSLPANTFTQDTNANDIVDPATGLWYHDEIYNTILSQGFIPLTAIATTTMVGGLTDGDAGSEGGGDAYNLLNSTTAGQAYLDVNESAVQLGHHHGQLPDDEHVDRESGEPSWLLPLEQHQQHRHPVGASARESRNENQPNKVSRTVEVQPRGAGPRPVQGPVSGRSRRGPGWRTKPFVTITTKEELPPASLPIGPRPISLNTRRSTEDRLFRGVTRGAGYFSFVILFLIGFFLFWRALPAFRFMGLSFFSTTGFVTSGPHPQFGVASALYGSVTIAVIAVFFAVPVSVGAALFINEYAPRSLLGFFPFKGLLTSMVDLMAAVPSVIYGLWGFFVLQPHMTGISKWLSVHLSWIPIFQVPPGTVVFTSSYFIAGTLVAIMIMPIVTSITREIISLTPPGEREGAMALGATRARVIRDVILPFARGGMIGAVMLGLGRALGEAVAVSIILSLVFGISPQILHSGGNSIAALIAARFGSGGSALGLSALLACGFVLFVFTLLINLAASAIVSRSKIR